MTKGIILNETPTNLQKQRLFEDTKANNGISIQGGMAEPLEDEPRLVAHYGGNLED